MPEDDISRRRILKLSGVALAGLAGCSGSPDSSSGDATAAGTRTRTATATTTATSTPTESGHHEEAGHETEDGHHEEGGHKTESGHHEGGGHKTESGHHEESGHKTESGHHEEGGHHHSEAIGEPVDHATVAMKTTDSGYHFAPHVVRVVPGGTVTWKLESGSHTSTAYHPQNDKPLRMPKDATPWNSGMLSENGATFEHTFEVEGVYDYYCVPHEAMGMLGSVIVGEPDPHEQPALAPPQDSLPKKARAKITDLNAMVNEALGHTHGEKTTTESGTHTEKESHHDG